MKLEITGKSFGSTTVLGAISLTVAPGEVLAVTGPSGIGKSTLARIMAGLDHDFDGTCSGFGRVGMVFQNPTLLPWRTALDNILIATGCDANAARDALDHVELGTRQDAFPGQLSLGQQRRVALARALAANPDTLILDEAFASLDEATAGRMRSLAQSILQGSRYRTILVTHNLVDVVHLADAVLLLGQNPAIVLAEHKISTPRPIRDLKAEMVIVRQKLHWHPNDYE